MNVKYKVSLFIILFISSISGFQFLIPYQTFSDTEKSNLHLSNSDMPDLIVFFNQSTFNAIVKNRFEYYGGQLKVNEEWNNIFNGISGFAGALPSENISIFASEFIDINLELDEIIDTQLNYASYQSGAVNSTWETNGFNGDTGSSIAVLDTGIDSNQQFLQGKISGWENFVDTAPISDGNGHGTLISSIIAGTGIDPYNSIDPSSILLEANYSHLDLFEEYIPSTNYTFKIVSFNATQLSSDIIVTSNWQLEESGIDDVWFELYFNSTVVNSTNNLMQSTNYQFSQQTSQYGTGIYDLYMKYHKQLNKNPQFYYNVNISTYPENYIPNFNHFTGVANASNIHSYKIVNNSGYGYTSDLISALGSVLQNKDTNKIVSACLSIGTLGNDVKAVTTAINEVADNGIVVVIAAGNSGVEGSNPLNKLALSENAIVVGATNDQDQVASYSSMGESINENTVKPDILAPGGSQLPGHRNILGAKANSDEVTGSQGTSISAAIIAAAINILIDARWNDWSTWSLQNTSQLAKSLKAILLMTASETNLDREDNPSTGIDESEYSPGSYVGIPSTIKDVHEGYGRVNIQAATEALINYVSVNSPVQGSVTSSEENPLAKHAFARRIKLNKDTQYIFELNNVDGNSNLDLFLFANSSKMNGEPILLETTRKWYGDFDSLYFTPKKNQTECVIVVKAISGESTFTLNISTVDNVFAPELHIPLVTYVGGQKNTTILSSQEYLGYNPNKNYTLDNYRFYIDYFDMDTSNVPPQEVYVSILETSINYSMSQMYEFDNNYTDGAIFRTDYLEFPTSGVYHYFFVGSDGLNKVRFPGLGYLNITLEFPDDSEQLPYSQYFNTGWNNWTFIGTGWNILNQSNQIDNRSLLYDTQWNSVYFGRDHHFPTNYTYQPYILSNPYPNGTLVSPLFNLTRLNENQTQPFANFGLRTSINVGDYIYLQANLNWTGWTTIKTYTNEESEWFIESINLTQYIGNFVQFQFITIVDDQYDPINYKGLMLDYFSLINYTNVNAPLIDFNISRDVLTTEGSIYEQFLINCKYFDLDNNYPEYIYLEIGNENHSMINSYGDWNVSIQYNEGDGITFQKYLILGNYNNQSFRFHVSDGKFIYQSPWYNQNNEMFTFEFPIELDYNLINSEKLIGYEFSNENLNDFYAAGEPTPKDPTAWLKRDNTWHPIERLGQNYLYGGTGMSYGGFEQGYGSDWDIKLITKPIQLRDEYITFLQYSFEISLQNEFYMEEDQLDKCSVLISTNYGEDWDILKEYFYDDDDLSGNESINLSQYSDEIVMIMFVLESNDNTIGLGYGWLLSNIYIGYDQNTDFKSPEVVILTPINDQVLTSTYTIEVNITDNIELDLDKIYLYIDGQIINRNTLSYDIDTNLLVYEWDTTLYNDGIHHIKIIAYDKEGNWIEESNTIIIQNGIFNFKTFGPWLIILGIAFVIGLVVFIKRKSWNKRLKSNNAEKVRLKSIDKDQIVKRIEVMELDELSRPMIVHCRYCKSWFSTKNYNYICPNCEHDQIFAAYNCLNCGKWYFKDEPGENYFCKNKSCEGVRLIRREKQEIKDLLAKEGKILKKYKKNDQKFSVLD
ncbi:MAG: S8 family serine peptidase [Candidatus Lokiarchaeota archaeon]|nr:S8 family serine peptidase [Candidatus Lokiarchaeota archaeon]